jgi:hypothetical protein
MKLSALAAALAAAMSFVVPASPALATIETEEARDAAAQAAESARAQMEEVFGATSLENGRYLWKDDAGAGEVTQVVVSLADQLAYALNGDELVAVSTISSGNDEHPTPTGIFDVLDKQTMHRSIKYDNAPMPWMLRIDDYGVALHAGHLPGYPASHGCVRLPSKFAAKLFKSVAVGTPVLIAS